MTKVTPSLTRNQITAPTSTRNQITAPTSTNLQNPTTGPSNQISKEISNQTSSKTPTQAQTLLLSQTELLNQVDSGLLLKGFPKFNEIIKDQREFQVKFFILNSSQL